MSNHTIAMSAAGRALCACGYLAVGRTRMDALRELTEHIDKKDEEQA